MFSLILMWMLVGCGVLGLITVLYFAWRGVPQRSIDDVVYFLYPVDSSLLAALLDPATDLDLRWNLGPRHFREAQRRLREAEEKVEKIKKWIPVLEHATAEYNSQSQPLGDRLAGRLVESFNVLERMIVALESYMALQAPTAPEVPAAGGAASGSDSKAAASTAASGGDAEPVAPAAEAAKQNR